MARWTGAWPLDPQNYLWGWFRSSNVGDSHRGGTYRVVVDIESVPADADTVAVRDGFLPESMFLERFGEGEELEDGVVGFGEFGADGSVEFAGTRDVLLVGISV